MLTKALFVASVGAGALASVQKEELNAHCKVSGTKKHVQLFQNLKKSIPGAGHDLEKVKGDFEAAASFKDGFSHVTCLNEGMRVDANLHKDPNRYGAQSLNVSVVYYDTLVASEDRKPMTTGVCFNFCRTLENMNFFGLNNGRECYCTPYYKAKAGGEDQICDAPCDGNAATMCGGKDKSDIYEMHLCQDTDSDIDISLGKLKDMEGKFLYEQFNLEESAKIMEHVADITKFYGKLGGDVLAGNQMMEAKKLVGKAVDTLVKGKKYSKQAKELMFSLGEKKTSFIVSKGEKSSDAAWMKETEDLISKQMALTPTLRQFVEKMDTIRTFIHETTKGNTTERVNQYFPVTQRQYLDVQKSDSDHKEMDSICQSKKDILRYVVANEGDCAYMCDKTVHPAKCSAYQYYPLVDMKQPSGTEWDWCRMQSSTPSGGNTDEFCHKIFQPSPTVKSYTVASTAHKDYVDFSRHGPFTLRIKPNPECDHLDFWDIGTGVMYVHKEDKDSEVVVKTGQSISDYPGHGRGVWDKTYTTNDYSKVSEMEFEFKEEKWYSIYTWYGKDCSAVVVEIDAPTAAPKTGVCALLADVEEVSYYTCPEDMREEGVNMQGENARCMLKASENQGFVAKKLKTLTVNKRCMVESRKEFPELDVEPEDEPVTGPLGP